MLDVAGVTVARGAPRARLGDDFRPRLGFGRRHDRPPQKANCGGGTKGNPRKFAKLLKIDWHAARVWLQPAETVTPSPVAGISGSGYIKVSETPGTALLTVASTLALSPGVITSLPCAWLASAPA